MGRARKAVSNSLYLSLDWLAATVLGYIFWVAAGKLLLPAELGVYSTIFALTFFIIQFDSLGINSAISKLIPEYEAKNRRKRTIGTIWWSFKVIFAINAVLAAVLAAMSSLISQSGYLAADQTILLSISIVVVALYTLSSNILFSFQKMRSLFLSNFAMNAAKAVVAIALILAGFSYAGAIAGFILAATATTAYRMLKLPRGRGKIDRAALWFYAMPAFIGTAGAAMMNQGSILILGLFRPMTDVGVFTIAFILTSVIRVVPQSIANAIFPMTSEQWAMKQLGGLRTLMTHSIRYSVLFTMPLILTIVVFFKGILLAIATSSYISPYSVALLLSVAYLVMGMGGNFTNVLYTTGMVDKNRNSILLGGLSNIALSLVLIPPFGMVGAAAALLVSGVVLFATAFIWSKRHLGFSIKFASLLKISAASVFYLAFMLMARVALPNFGPFYIFGVAFVAAVGVVIYVAALFALKFFEEIDIRLMDEFGQNIPRVARPVLRCIRTMLSKNLNRPSARP